MVKAFPRAVVGFARLELVNEPDSKPVVVKNVLIGTPGDGPKYPAIAQEIALAPAQGKTVDMTSTVLKVIGGNGKGPVQIRLHLNPEPSDQPAPALYFCETASGRVVEFRSS